MRDPKESRAAMEAYTTYTVQTTLLNMAIDKWMKSSLLAALSGNRDALDKMNNVFESYAMKVLPQIIDAKKYMGVDCSTDQKLFDAIRSVRSDNVGVYSLDDILKDFKTQEDKDA